MRRNASATNASIHSGNRFPQIFLQVLWKDGRACSEIRALGSDRDQIKESLGTSHYLSADQLSLYSF